MPRSVQTKRVLARGLVAKFEFEPFDADASGSVTVRQHVQLSI